MRACKEEHHEEKSPAYSTLSFLLFLVFCWMHGSVHLSPYRRLFVTLFSTRLSPSFVEEGFFARRFSRALFSSSSLLLHSPLAFFLLSFILCFSADVSSPSSPSFSPFLLMLTSSSSCLFVSPNSLFLWRMISSLLL